MAPLGMSGFSLRHVMLVFLTTASIACTTPEMTSDAKNEAATASRQAPMTPVTIVVDLAKVSVVTDAATIEHGSVEGNLLTLNVSYRGGSREHVFKLYALQSVMKSLPPQAQLYVSHDAQGDKAILSVRKALYFDLTPLQRLVASGPLVLRIHAPGELDYVRPAPRYEF